MQDDSITSQITSVYDPAGVETKWYQYWLDHKLFEAHVDHSKKPYTIIMPPPNVTGVLHMGHMLNNTIQDILIRRARIAGYNACWVPGTDHASIATEAKVVDQLAKQGIQKNQLTREDFLKHAWEWTDKYGGIILSQLRRLGVSCDWSRTAFTLDEERSESVINVFCKLYEEGLIYRGVRVVNWDPKAQTALSDEEVIFKEHQGKLYYLRYFIEGTEDYIVVATTRPETIMGDTAVCINPTDPRYHHLRGKRVIVPLVGRSVPIIEDEYVDLEFGTGCLKVTPAHDINDYQLGITHQLETIDIFNNDGTLNEHGGKYAGKDRFVVRKEIVADLKEAGLLDHEEDYNNRVGYSERTDVAIEPKLSMQWFLKMSELAKPALQAVLEDTVQLVPKKFVNTYRYWLENIKDWCISRQLWWGHRIPAYYLPNGQFVVAATAEEALAKAKQETGDNSLTLEQLNQESDCLDTWFSSWLWPISLFGKIDGSEPTEDLKYFYPTSVLVTGPDILFFWVARMIMAGYHFMGDRPFDKVYLTGIVRDDKGRKMSKSLGNSPDPIDLMDKYGADGVRLGLMMATSAGNDLLYDESLVEQGRNFCNKIWNSYRFLKTQSVSDEVEPDAASLVAMEWFESLLASTMSELDDLFDKYRISDAVTLLYKLVRDDFSGLYLEAIKPAYGTSMSRDVYERTIHYFEQIFILLHPFMPFITEELWQDVAPRQEGDSIMYAHLDDTLQADKQLLADMEHAVDLITKIRSIRSAHQIATKQSLALTTSGEHPERMSELVIKLANLSAFTKADAHQSEEHTAEHFIIGTVPYSVELAGAIDVEKTVERLRGELAHQEKFLAGVRKKLSNEKFVANAKPEVVALERKKESDALLRIDEVQQQLKQLGATL